jgi:hypothetical protein
VVSGSSSAICSKVQLSISFSNSTQSLFLLMLTTNVINPFQLQFLQIKALLALLDNLNFLNISLISSGISQVLAYNKISIPNRRRLSDHFIRVVYSINKEIM